MVKVQFNLRHYSRPQNDEMESEMLQAARIQIVAEENSFFFMMFVIISLWLMISDDVHCFNYVISNQSMLFVSKVIDINDLQNGNMKLQ